MQRRIFVLLWGCWVASSVWTLAAQVDNEFRYPAFVYWPSGARTMALVQGQTHEYEAGFESVVPIENAFWTVTRELQQFFGANPTFVSSYVEPEQVYKIRHTIQVPRDFPLGTYNGNLVVLGTRGRGPQGGPKSGSASSPIPMFLRLRIEILPAP